MILHVSYEEVQALRAGARVCLGDEVGVTSSPVLAPSETRARVEALLPWLGGDLSLSTLEELRVVQGGIDAVVECLRIEMESTVMATHAADESAVAAYFDFAHALSVKSRVEVLAGEMEAMIELVTGEAPSEESARSFQFPD